MAGTIHSGFEERRWEESLENSEWVRRMSRYWVVRKAGRFVYILSSASCSLKVREEKGKGGLIEAYLDIESEYWVFSPRALETSYLGVEEVVWTLTRSRTGLLLWTLLRVWVLVLVVGLSWVWLLVLPVRVRRFISLNVLFCLLGGSGAGCLWTGIVVAVGSFIVSVGRGKAAFAGVAVGTVVLLAGHVWGFRSLGLEGLAKGSVVLW